MNRVEEFVNDLRSYQILWNNLQEQYREKAKGESYCFRRDQLKRKISYKVEKLSQLLQETPIWFVKSQNKELIIAGQTEEELRSILVLLGIKDFEIKQIKRENIHI